MKNSNEGQFSGLPASL